ncbi:hypothetical protein SNOG_08873 [Parastagonospora nodorum SN15]|uniref:Uncharacterized protein n=1 Tax=Phaeosphaeria nodorum (strain SN15 / ATCC MYA-4574 / FGSC 10173) TaxID=321614 RepID=Q0UH91_PHANO|nr:hypothetical protein SNOG_08873 [Parastagonospora nodorum SN15]EAT84041.1 hypothetical protein SNOG_08873 [Parastagonospora nodorum SN15]
MAWLLPPLKPLTSRTASVRHGGLQRKILDHDHSASWKAGTCLVGNDSVWTTDAPSMRQTPSLV